MGRLSARPQPSRERALVPARRLCVSCGGVARIRYENRRTLVMLSGPVRLRLKIRRCDREGCARRHVPCRPEAEGALALPQHEFGLDVVTLVGTLRHRDHRSVPEIHALLRGRGVEIAERSVTNLLDRYDELLATAVTNSPRLQSVLARQGRAILALDGMQPDVGHEVLWMVRECLSGEVLLARSLLSGTAADLVPLLREVDRRPVRDDGWRLPDELWSKMELLLPLRPQHLLGCHSPRVPDRAAMDAIFFMLRTGCPWNALRETGLCSLPSAHRLFQEWAAAGVFAAFWREGLLAYDVVAGSDWTWLALDGAMGKAPLGGRRNGAQPYGSGQAGS